MVMKVLPKKGTMKPGTEVKFSISGQEMQKVLYYYGLLQSTDSALDKIICPLHQDVNPSMLVDYSEGRFFCFGCQKSGDALRLVTEIEQNNGLNALQAMQKYFYILNSEKVEQLKTNVVLSKPREDNPVLRNMAADYYFGLKTIDWESDYEYDDLTFGEVVKCSEYMAERGFSVFALNQCNAKITYTVNYPLIFPMFDNGKFKGWVCRTTSKVVESKRKYLYNEGFSRATTLVGVYGNKFNPPKRNVYIVEGYMDRLKFLQYGEQNVVAILGWKITSEQIQKLKDAGVTNVYSALDNDECGKKGTEHLKKFFKVRPIVYPRGCKDPGDMTYEQFKWMQKQTGVGQRVIR